MEAIWTVTVGTRSESYHNILVQQNLNANEEPALHRNYSRTLALEDPVHANLFVKGAFLQTTKILIVMRMRMRMVT